VRPPIQYATIASLLCYGFQKQAQTPKEKYVEIVAFNFEQTGNLREKCNVISAGIDTESEYEMPAEFGWTAGTFIFVCEVIGEKNFIISPISRQSYNDKFI